MPAQGSADLPVLTRIGEVSGSSFTRPLCARKSTALTPTVARQASSIFVICLNSRFATKTGLWLERTTRSVGTQVQLGKIRRLAALADHDHVASLFLAMTVRRGPLAQAGFHLDAFCLQDRLGILQNSPSLSLGELTAWRRVR